MVNCLVFVSVVLCISLGLSWVELETVVEIEGHEDNVCLS